MPPNCGLSDTPKTSTLPKKASGLKPSNSMLSMLRIGPTNPDFGASSSSSTKSGDIFEVELSALPGGDDEVPVVVTLCITAIERRGGLEMEGLYRIPGIKGEIDKLRMHFSYGRPNLDDEGLLLDAQPSRVCDCHQHTQFFFFFLFFFRVV